MSESKDWTARLLQCAVGDSKMKDREVIEMFADESNWTTVHVDGFCHWAWMGPNRPPFELLQRQLKRDS